MKNLISLNLKTHAFVPWFRQLVMCSGGGGSSTCTYTDYEKKLSPNELMAAGLWRTYDGEIIAVRDMTDSHLLNAYRMCFRNGRTTLSGALGKEIVKRGIQHKAWPPKPWKLA